MASERHEYVYIHAWVRRMKPAKNGSSFFIFSQMFQNSRHIAMKGEWLIAQTST